MKTSRYTEAQIIAILRQAEGGVPVAHLCRPLSTLGNLSKAGLRWEVGKDVKDCP